MEVEFEERIFKDIKDLGKYILYLDITYQKDMYNPIVIQYLKKYPHIKLRLMDKKLPHKVKEINVKDLISTKIPI